MNRPEVVAVEESLFQQGSIHLSFSVGTKEKVDELTRTLAEQGSEVLSGARITGDGFYENCLVEPEGDQMEITE